MRFQFDGNQRYQLRAIEAVAIREGVLKSLKITQDHLRSLYDNVPYRYTVYASKSIGKVRQFAQSDCVELLVMTIDSFNKDDNVIRQSTDRLQGATPIYLVQSARPVLILDEPQNMESEARIKALASLHPLFALRYSATHRNPYNLVYRLTPFEAYRQGLVKKIEVASVVQEDDYNQLFLRLDEIRSDKKTVQARLAVHQRMANGTISERLVPVANSVYDHILVDSDAERKFVERLKNRKDVRLFVKLPAWFKVPTPVGTYNPDWALVMEQVDAHGDPGPLLYLVRETKSTTVAAELRGTENQKIHCGERHFIGALGVDYKAIKPDAPLP
jgi:restriction endonuclease